MWAIDLISPDKKVDVVEDRGRRNDRRHGGSDARHATARSTCVDARDGTAAAPAVSNTIVALEPKTLKQKAVFTQPKADFATSPLVFDHKGKDVVAAAGRTAGSTCSTATSMQTPLDVTPKYSNAGATGGLATWQSDGTRWILAPAVGGAQPGSKAAANGPVTNGSIVAFKVVDAAGSLSLEPAWASRDLTSPAAPIIFNGVVFALSTGEHRPANANARRLPVPRRRFRPCCTRSTRPPARNCGRAARRSRRLLAAGSRRQLGRCTS